MTAVVVVAVTAVETDSSVVAAAVASGWTRHKTVRVTKLNASVHWGTSSKARDRLAVTKVAAEAPITVAVVAKATLSGAIKTDVAHPTKQPLYVNKPFSVAPSSNVPYLAAVEDVNDPSAAIEARKGSPIARLASKIFPDVSELRKMT